MAMNREQKRLMQRQGALTEDGEPQARARQAGGGRPPSERTSPVEFVKEVRTELRKVAWPTRPEVVNYSIVVLITLVILTSFIALLDWGFGEFILWLFDA